MADEIERLVIGVRADTRGFATDVTAMRGELTGPLAEGAGRAGQMIERSLGRALASGRFGFDQLKKVALTALAEIAAASVKALLQPAAGGGAGGREVRVGITLTSPRPDDPQALRQSSRHVARAVRSALRGER